MSARERNVPLWAGFVQASAQTDFRDIKLNGDLFNKLTPAACFNQCAQTDVDIVYINEMECTYKCIITYKQSLALLRELDRQ